MKKDRKGIAEWSFFIPFFNDSLTVMTRVMSGPRRPAMLLLSGGLDTAATVLTNAVYITAAILQT